MAERNFIFVLIMGIGMVGVAIDGFLKGNFETGLIGLVFGLMCLAAIYVERFRPWLKARRERDELLASSREKTLLKGEPKQAPLPESDAEKPMRDLQSAQRPHVFDIPVAKPVRPHRPPVLRGADLVAPCLKVTFDNTLVNPFLFQGSLYVCMDESFVKLSSQGEILHTIATPGLAPRLLFAIDEDRLVFATKKGVHLYTLSRDQWEFAHSELAKASRLAWFDDEIVVGYSTPEEGLGETVKIDHLTLLNPKTWVSRDLNDYSLARAMLNDSGGESLLYKVWPPLSTGFISDLACQNPVFAERVKFNPDGPRQGSIGVPYQAWMAYPDAEERPRESTYGQARDGKVLAMFETATGGTVLYWDDPTLQPAD